MSRRLPIIASDIPANREVLGDEDALWVKPESDDDIRGAVERAVADTEAFRTPVESNYRRVAENNTWRKVAEKYIAYLTARGLAR